MLPWKRRIEAVLAFAGIMFFMAASFGLLTWNVAIFAGIGCFVAIGVLDGYF